MEKKDNKIISTKNWLKKNYWMVASVLFAILFVASTLTSVFNFSEISESDAKVKVQDFLENKLGMTSAVILSIDSEGSLYNLDADLGGQPAEIYVSKDGKYLVQPLYDMDMVIEGGTDQPSEPQQQNIPKSDKPIVELFIMSHCPYGTQIEKGMLPVANLLGDKMDFEIKFVDYAMHGEVEVTEQLNQYCIQKDQNDKYLDYLECFLIDSDGERCIAETNVDSNALSTCVEKTDKEFAVIESLEDESKWVGGNFPPFNIHKLENELYGVQGSPTLVINGEQVSSGRDSNSLLTTVCGAFNEQPEECGVEFEQSNPSPGFGWDEASSNNLASCDA